jgi:hypothetical protein
MEEYFSAPKRVGRSVTRDSQELGRIFFGELAKLLFGEMCLSRQVGAFGNAVYPASITSRRYVHVAIRPKIAVLG